jgi:hypothetical protein
MAVFTIMKNEDFFLPVWLRHYKKLFDSKDIYILNNGGKIDVDVSVEDVKHPRGVSFDHEWLRDIVCDYQRHLLNHYDWVYFAEADELLAGVPGLPASESLKYIDLKGAGAPTVQLISRDVVHDPFKEPPIDTNRHFLEQRGWWMHRMHMDKPTLTSVPVTYLPGFHAFVGDPPPYITCMTLFLIHMNRLDYFVAKNRVETRSKWRWNELDIKYDLARQSRVVDKEFDTWFLDGVLQCANTITSEWRTII